MIELVNVTKRYGDLTAVDDLSLSIGPGELFGFIGPNGAGKTTSMKMLACLLTPDSGTARVDGLDIRRHGDQIRTIIGYMPDFLGVYEDLTVDEYLHFFAAAFRIERKRRRGLIDQSLELTDLTHKKTAMVNSLSRGMQQRLGIARVLIHDPKVLLLDEPASGLDPRARIEIRELLTELRKMGKTLMVSSHILSELAEMSTSIGIIERGKLLYAGSIAEAYDRVRGGERVKLSLENHAEAGERVRTGLVVDERVEQVAVTGDGTFDIRLAEGRHGHHFLIELVIAAGGRIASFEPLGINLEETFLRLTKGEVQ